MEIVRKSINPLNIEWKADKEGSFSAVIATLNVRDHDDDITIPGAFPADKKMLISAYQHGSWQGALTVGKASLVEVNDKVVAEGLFNLKTVTGREHYETVKFNEGLQEWSYGFYPTDWEMKEVDGQQCRILKRVDPVEISPVLQGAGIGTATIGIKGLSFTDEIATALELVRDLSVRAKSLADLKRKEGKDLTDTNRANIAGLIQILKATASDLDAVLVASSINNGEALKLFLQYSRIISKYTEVH